MYGNGNNKPTIAYINYVNEVYFSVYKNIFFFHRQNENVDWLYFDREINENENDKNCIFPV